MQLSRRLALLAFVVVASSPWAHTHADEQVCRDPLTDWRVDSGELRRGAQCGTLIGTTDASTATFSYAHFTRRTPVELPYEFQITWRSLTNHGPLELGLLGSMVLLTSEQFGLFFSNESFEWIPLPGYRTQQEHSVVVRQDAKEVTLFVNGVKVHTWAFTATTKRGELAVAMKGPRSNRARMLFRDVQVRPLPNITDNPPTPR